MKKLFQIGAVFLGILVAQAGFAQNTPVQAATTAPSQTQATVSQQGSTGYGQSNAYVNYGQSNGYNNYGQSNGYNYGYQNTYGGQGQGAGGCPEDQPCADEATNDCWCKYVHYEPCYYTTKRCVEEQIPCKKRCCRMVPKYYEVQRCRYVPQYYCETCCTQEPEYYEVDDCKCCKRWVCDTHCNYVPRYYWKHVCGDNGCATPCPTR